MTEIIRAIYYIYFNDKFKLIMSRKHLMSGYPRLKHIRFIKKYMV